MKRPVFSGLRAATALALAVTFSLAAQAAHTPARLISAEEPHFPDRVLLEGITTGEAWVLVSVDAEGRLTDALVTRHTHQAFAAEALATVRAARFEPARVDDRPVTACTELHFIFRASQAVVNMNASSTVLSLSAFAGGAPVIEEICRAADLDAALRPVRAVTPRPRAGEPGGRATLEFIVDAQGHPRMPVLVTATHPDLSARAAAALSQWEFAPPSRAGRPTAVRVRQEFIFPAGTSG